ncbi:hypothetical protein AVEN_195188-1 [Araneus ventricosus]|uniref:Uncharacterized protein n=1 Tax=Araneus ventricosus TaxID=182803 RepID=A0A4Y2JF99_ARAVE|nr:hypothetical protein AVEN_195188-1 [Araneus ventricosus]
MIHYLFYMISRCRDERKYFNKLILRYRFRKPGWKNRRWKNTEGGKNTVGGKHSGWYTTGGDAGGGKVYSRWKNTGDSNLKVEEHSRWSYQQMEEFTELCDALSISSHVARCETEENILIGLSIKEMSVQKDTQKVEVEEHRRWKNEHRRWKNGHRRRKNEHRRRKNEHRSGRTNTKGGGTNTEGGRTQKLEEHRWWKKNV